MNVDYKSIENAWSVFSEKLEKVNTLLDLVRIEKAFRMAWEAHDGQVRKSGEPYIMHPISVSLICAEQGMGTTTVIAALLHDVIEDTKITFEQVEREFDLSVATIVDGVTKLVSIKDKHQKKVETYRKILQKAAEDVRVMIIKFADRVHNLRTLTHMSNEKRARIAKETLDIYAPIAHRLGMGNIKTELEDLAFRHLYPDRYQEVLEKTAANEHHREEVIDRFRNTLIASIKDGGIEAEVFGRTKSYYSIYKKNHDRHAPYTEIFDLLAMRVICSSTEECYRVLGVVHSLWTPVPDKLKDYIASPKSNGYQSIHTTIAGPKGNLVEIQIRTWEMNYIAEEGVAAHWRYKDKNPDSRLEDHSALAWLRNLVEWQKELKDTVEFYEFFKIDISDTEITVRTPMNKKVMLPIGATILDFAFTIHSDIGLHCIGAKVNGQVQNPDYKLKDNDMVEVLHSFDKQPNIEWLHDVATPRARSEIKRWLRKVESVERVSLGRKLFYSHYNRLHLHRPLSDFIEALLEKFSLQDEDSFYERVALDSTFIGQVATFLVGNIGTGEEEGEKVVQEMRIAGFENFMVRYAQCCHPVPGDEIVGFLTNGRGVSVHRLDCPNVSLFKGDRAREVKLGWDHGSLVEKRIARVTIDGDDREGLIKDIAEVFERNGVSINQFTFSTGGSRATGVILAAVETVSELYAIKKQLRKIDGVTKVARAFNIQDEQ